MNTVHIDKLSTEAALKTNYCMTQIYRMDCKEESGLHIQAGKQFSHEIINKAMQILQF